MHVLLFEPRFCELVASGRKQHTIRGQRKRPIHPGQLVSLRRWIGQPYRSKQETLAEGVVTGVQGIAFRVEKRMGSAGFAGWRTITRLCVEIDGVELTPREANALAKRDGFGDINGMHAYWRGRLPWDGVLIRWRLG